MLGHFKTFFSRVSASRMFRIFLDADGIVLQISQYFSDFEDPDPCFSERAHPLHSENGQIFDFFCIVRRNSGVKSRIKYEVGLVAKELDITTTRLGT